ncbi:venom allergen 5-like [Rhipicephalus sanguineus]|uniref:venom allergen 5-like n=1 Tax=Rhipicephalus sanguineus TaxID=34632 RepID=UPI0020C3C461|nr:venom allergen 5-like [Rhipicephalus sanguineus]
MKATGRMSKGSAHRRMLEHGMDAPIFALMLLLTLIVPDASKAEQSTCNVPPQNGVNAAVCEKPNPRCNIMASGLVDGDQANILSLHNQDRSHVALGELDDFPPARNMYKMVWSDEIAESAQAYANQCGEGLGPGRHSSQDQRRTEHFSFIGENIAHEAFTANITMRRWEVHIHNWFKEYQYYPPESVSNFQPPPGPEVTHFTQGALSVSYAA